MDNLRKVPVYGVLIVGNHEYLLLNPVPLSRDSWQDNERRWLVTRPTGDYDPTSTKSIYCAPYHLIVSGPYVIEYSSRVELMEVFVIDISDVWANDDESNPVVPSWLNDLQIRESKNKEMKNEGN